MLIACFNYREGLVVNFIVIFAPLYKAKKKINI